MRLVIDATIAGSRMSGLERYTTEVGGRLAAIKADEGMEVSLLIRRGSRAEWAKRLPHRADLLVESPSVSSLVTQQFWIPRMLQRKQADVAFFPGFPPSPLTFQQPRLRTVRTIFDAVMWAAPETTSRKNKLYYRPLETFGSHHYSQIHTISQHARAEIEHYLPWTVGRVAVSGCGVSASSEPDPRGARAFGVEGAYLLFVGTIEPRKNLPFLLDVFTDILREQPAVKLVIAGRPGWGQTVLAEQIVAKGVEGAVVLTGAISEAMLSALYREAAMLVFPSLYEGFGLPVVEAMKQGLPVISSDAASLPEVAGDAAITLAPHDKLAWTNAIRGILGDESLRRQMCNKGKLQAKRFEWDAVARRIGDTL